MYSPRSSQATGSKAAMVPEGFGIAIPSNPQDLLKLIQQQHKRNVSKASQNSNIIGRAQKQEQQREIYENKLMEFEDFIYKPEGAERLQRHFEHLRMETEDDLSMQVEAVERSKKVIDFKEQVRLEVAERKRQEEAEKEAKRKAAEERRAAVVERLRKKAEEEERRRLEAEAALLRIHEEGLRKEQWEKDRIATDQITMVLEDELSHLAEQDHKEKLEKLLYLQREKAKLAEWEAAQQAKDAEEAQLRIARMAALEEKKAKLAELKRLQLLSSGKDETSSSAITNARDEAAKLNKQLRIQNKAKFVTKKIQKGGNNGNDAELVNDMSALSVGDTESGHNASFVKSNNISEGAGSSSQNNTLNSDLPRVTSSAQMSVSVAKITTPLPQTAEEAAYLQSTASIDSEVELKNILKELMAEKRELRLEQKQRIAAGGGAQGAAELSHAKALRKKIADVTAKESAVQKRLDKLFAAAQNPTLNGGGGGSEGTNGLGGGSTHSASAAALLDRAPVSIGPETSGPEATVPLSSAANSNTADSSKTLYSRADQLLREGAQLTQWLADKSHEQQNSEGPEVSQSAMKSAPSLGMLNKSFGRSFALGKTTDESSVQRRATLLLLEVGKVVKELDPSRDIGNYAEGLAAMSATLKSTLATASAAEKDKEKDKPASDKTSSNSSSDNGANKSQTALSVGKLTGIAELAPANTTSTSVPAPASSSTPAISQAGPQKIETKTDQKASPMHVSASTSNLPTVHTQRKEDHLLSSTSSSQIPAMVDSPKVESASLSSFAETTSDAQKNVAANNNISAPVSAAPTIGLSVVSQGAESSPEENEDNEEVGQEGEDGAEEEEITNFEDIPGWQECLTTTMASAAHHAAFHGYSEVLEVLCRYFDCFVMDKKGRTPLFYAALQNRLSCVATLVALDSQWIDVGDQNGDTSLHAAAIANGVGVLSFLLSCEANPDTANYAGLTPCHLARTREALEALCEAGAQAYCVDTKSRMPLWFACSEGRSDCAEFLCEKTPPQYLLWPDDEGETCLHRAAMNGHAQALETLCQWLPSTDDLHAVNRKNYTAAHVASNAAVLKALYENGANVWITDPKGRMPIFMASFFGRADCVAFLLDIASTSSTDSAKDLSASKKAKIIENANIVSAPDNAGDTALHAACMCGHLQCVSLLLYFTRCVRNKQGLSPDELALRAKHEQIAQLVALIEQKKNEQLSSLVIFGVEFSMLSAVMLYYGARWSKLYDANFDTVYYLDRATGTSQWERPEAFDEPAIEENRTDKARAVLHRFYSTYNPEKLSSMNDILFMYKNKYTELFISLADKYNVEDLTMFEGVDLD